jgi:hypothetical protein
MLVALLVGAIRSTAELNPDPFVILQALNRHLRQRRTLPPYLNGRPLHGRRTRARHHRRSIFSVKNFQLHSGDKLVVIPMVDMFGFSFNL